MNEKTIRYNDRIVLFLAHTSPEKMSNVFQFLEGTANQFSQAKKSGTLLPKSFYLVEGKPHLALTQSTAFSFVDAEMVSEMIAGLSTGEGGTVTLGNNPGKAPTTLGSPGSSELGARSDHTHPAQTTISGNANTATTAQTANKLTNPRTIRLTGAITGHAQFSGENDCTLTTTLEAGLSGPSFWYGTESQLPSARDPNTIYFVYEN